MHTIPELFFLLNKLKFINESGRALWQATFKTFSGNSCVPVNEGSVLGFVGTKREKPSFIKNWKLCQFGRRPGSQWVKIWHFFCFIHCQFPCFFVRFIAIGKLPQGDRLVTCTCTVLCSPRCVIQFCGLGVLTHSPLLCPPPERRICDGGWRRWEWFLIIPSLREKKGSF